MKPSRAQSLHELGYELIDELGRGGMGKVWRARDLKLDREVAIKFIANAAVDARARQRFHVEARALARIKHPNVVVVYQLGELDGVPFLAYELVDGVNIDELVGELDWREALSLIGDLARGLAAVHEAGVLHRDLKPANAMVTRKGVAKLIDFGLAKLGDDDDDDDDEPEPERPSGPPTVDPRLAAALLDEDSGARTVYDGHDSREASATATHAVLGTPRYLAPELWAGQFASPATDVYALGVIAWELLGKRRAHSEFEGDALARAIVDRPLPALLELDPELPPSLAALVDRAVTKAPEARFTSAQAFVEALDQVVDRLRALGEIEAEPSERSGAELSLQRPPPQTRWIRAGDLSLAIQQFGAGPVDLVFIHTWVSHCEVAWQLPEYAQFMARLGRLARVTVFDKRGTGMSDHMHEPAPIEERMLDIAAILDALELDSAVLFGVQDGGVLASAFAATHPERVRGLVWYASALRLLASKANPAGMPLPMFEHICQAILEHWGAPLFADFAAPSRVDDPAFMQWWSDYLRNGASPSAARWMFELNATIEVEPVLPAIGAPTLVLHRRGDRMMPLPGGKLVAQRIPEARWVELDGEDHMPWLGDARALLEPVAEFLGQLDALPRGDRRLASLLAIGDSVIECSGPVAAIRRALATPRDRPALVHVGSTDQDPASLVRRMGARLVELELAATSVVATRSAAFLAGGAGLEFTALDDPEAELFVVKRG